MATAEQMQQTLQELQQRVALLATQLETERTRNGGVAQIAEALSRIAEKDRGGAKLVDTRGVGRPANFGAGDEKTLEKSFPVWQRELLNYVVSIYPDMKEPLGLGRHSS